MRDQICLVCGRLALFGYGLPPQATLWACKAHRMDAEAAWVAAPYTPLPRAGKRTADQVSAKAAKQAPKLRLQDRLTR